MSDLLRLREWLGLSDAMRYLKHIGLDASIEDFFYAYTASDYPLKVDFKNPPLYFFEPIGNSYPHWVENGECLKYGEWKSEKGIMHRTNIPLDVAAGNVQTGYGSGEAVWVRAIVGEIDWDNFDLDKDYHKTVPIYWDSSRWNGDYDESCFEMVFWGQLLSNSLSNSLIFSRSHIDKLYQRTQGKNEEVIEEPQQKKTHSKLSFCDNTHDSYPPELHAALLLWEGLYIKGEKNPNHPHQQAASLWLEKNKDSLPTADLINAGSDAMTKRLITITTPSAKKPKK